MNKSSTFFRNAAALNAFAAGLCTSGAVNGSVNGSKILFGVAVFNGIIALCCGMAWAIQITKDTEN